jgi:hypothetical protein
MKTILNITLLLAFGLALASCMNTPAEAVKSGPVKVELKKEKDGYRLYCDGKPFYIKGAGLEGGNIEALAQNGGNAFRTWSTESKSHSGKETLDEAHRNGLMVCMGIDIARERHGFDYDDSAAVAAQFNRVKEEVMKYKDHPALLAWGIGNELNLSYTNPRVWNAVNDIAAMIHETDPNHPVTTMFAGAGKKEVEYVMERCPEIDFLCFQIYGDMMNLPKHIAESGWQGAYVVSEWGTRGHWEVATTSWGRPIEPTSHERAVACKEWYEAVITADTKQCIGSFVFLWGQKQERTPTWYGLFLEDGRSTETVDVMHYLWNGKWPENQAPKLDNFLLNDMTAQDNIMLAPGEKCSATVNITEPDNDPVSYRWEILSEVPEDQQSHGGDFEMRPVTVLNSETGAGINTFEFEAPLQEGDYRLFVYAGDGKNKAATANIPFYVAAEVKEK